MKKILKVLRVVVSFILPFLKGKLSSSTLDVIRIAPDILEAIEEIFSTIDSTITNVEKTDPDYASYVQKADVAKVSILGQMFGTDFITSADLYIKGFKDKTVPIVLTEPLDDCNKKKLALFRSTFANFPKDFDEKKEA